MKNVKLLISVFLVVLVFGLGYQIFSLNIEWKQRAENIYTPASIVDDSRRISTLRGSLIFPEQPDKVSPQPGDLALASYRYAKLLQHKFPDLLTKDHRRSLLDISNDTEQPDIVRLYAYAALKYAGEEYDTKTANMIVEDLFSSFPENIDYEIVSSYMDVAEVSLDLNPNVQLKTLEEFPATENTERLTVAILSQTYLFSNEAEVKSMFPEIHQKINYWVFGEDSLEAVDRYLLSSLAYINLNTLTYEERTILEEKDSTLSRCEYAPSFIAVEVNGEEICSLMLTEIYYQRGIWNG